MRPKLRTESWCNARSSSLSWVSWWIMSSACVGKATFSSPLPWARSILQRSYVSWNSRRRKDADGLTAPDDGDGVWKLLWRTPSSVTVILHISRKRLQRLYDEKSGATLWIYSLEMSRVDKDYGNWLTSGNIGKRVWIWYDYAYSVQDLWHFGLKAGQDSRGEGMQH